MLCAHFMYIQYMYMDECVCTCIYNTCTCMYVVVCKKMKKKYIPIPGVKPGPPG